MTIEHVILTVELALLELQPARINHHPLVSFMVLVPTPQGLDRVEFVPHIFARYYSPTMWLLQD